MAGLALNIGLGSARGAAGSAPPASLILDSFSAAGAYSTRKLRTAYTGAALRVRRSSDNTQQDIGFSGNALDTAALSSFVGAGDGFVVTWYDQSGNGMDITQATALSQPRIVNAGVIETKNSLPTVNFYSSNRLLRTTGLGLFAAGVATVFAVMAQNAGDAGFVWEEGDSTTGDYYGGATSASNGVGWVYTVTGGSPTVTENSNPPLVTGATSSNLAALAWRDTGLTLQAFSSTTAGSIRNMTARGTSTRNRFAIGAGARNPDLPILAHISEVILFPLNMSNANLNTIRADQGTAFGITVNPI